MCGRSDDLREWCRLIAGFSGGGISGDSIGISVSNDGGGVMSMAAAGTTAGTFAGNEGVIMVHVVGVVMKGGAETGADVEAGTIGDDAADDIDGNDDIGFTNQDGFKTGTVRPLDGLSICCGSGSTNGVLSL